MAFRASFLGVMALTLAGQIAAVGFEIGLAARFGTGAEADALAVALLLVITPSLELTAWVSTVFLPLYVAAREAGTNAAAFLRRAAAALLALTALLAAGIGVLAPALSELVAPVAAGITGVLVRGFVPLLVLMPAAALLMAVLQAHGRFQIPALRQLFWYGGGLAAVVFAARAAGPVAVPMGMAGGLLVFVVLLAIRARTALPPDGGASDAGARLTRAGALLIPLALVSIVNYFNIAFERAIAARLPEGSVAALTYASRLMSFPFNLFIVNATTMLLPALATFVSRRDEPALAAVVAHAARLAIVFVTPLAALAIALAEPGTRVLLEHGAFSSESTGRTATALAWYAPGFIAMAAVQVLYRTYQALHAVWRLAVVSTIGIASSIVLMPTLVALIGYRGLPLAASLTMAVLLVAMLAGLRRRLPGLVPVVAAVIPRAAAAGLAALVAAWIARALVGSDVLALVAGGGAGVGAYALVLAAIAPADARSALALLVPAPRRSLAEP